MKWDSVLLWPLCVLTWLSALRLSSLQAQKYDLTYFYTHPSFFLKAKFSKIIFRFCMDTIWFLQSPRLQFDQLQVPFSIPLIGFHLITLLYQTYNFTVCSVSSFKSSGLGHCVLTKKLLYSSRF